MANELNIKLQGDASALQNALSLAANALKELEKQVRNATNPIDDLEKKSKKSAQALKDMAKQAADIGKTMSMYVTTPLVAAGTASIKMASDFNESLNKVDVSFKSASASVTEFAKTSLKTYGIASGTALDMASNFGDMATSMGLGVGEASKLSTSLVGLAGDMASFKNIRIDVAQTALNGIFTGETESLKRLGIVMTEANVKAYAFSQGITKQYDTMSQAEKVMLRYQYVMSVTKNAQGDFARTNENAANQMRMFGEGTKQLSAEIGQVMLPVVTSITRAANEMISEFSGASESTKGFIVVLGGIAAATGPLLFLVGTIVPKVIEGFNLMSAAAVKFNLTLSTATGIVGLAALFGVAAKSAYDFAKALKPDNKLTEAQKKDLSAIKEKNTEILASIELLKKQKAMASGIKTGMDTAGSVSVAGIDAQIASQQKLLVQNNALIASIQKKQQEEAKAAQKATEEADKKAKEEQARISKSLAAKEKAQKVEKDNLLEMQLLKLKNAALDESIAKKELKIAKFQAFGDTSNVKDLPTFAGDLVKHFEKFPAIGEKIMGITTNLGTLKSPLSVMDASIQASTLLQTTQLDGLLLKYNQIMTVGQMVADTTGQAFTALGDSIVKSMGFASTGFEGFAQIMLQTLVKLGSMILQQIVMNQASAMGAAIAGATQSGAATGPAAVFTTPAFIATAIGGVLSAFAAIPKFAAGGIVSGPTMGLMGEYPGAKSNPEVIAPLSKLQGMLDQGNGGTANVSGEFVLRGQDLVVALQRAEKQRNRIG
jgi:hypothetical protein